MHESLNEPSIQSRVDGENRRSVNFFRSLRAVLPGLTVLGLLSISVLARRAGPSTPSAINDATSAGPGNGPPAPANAAEVLTLAVNSDAALSGTLVVGAATVQFDGRLDASGDAIGVVSFENQTIQWVYDADADRLSVEGGGAILTAESIEIFQALSDRLNAALDDEGSAKGRLPTHKAVIAAEAAWLAAGQAGTAIDAFSSGLSRAPADGQAAYAGFYDDGVTCLEKGVSKRY